PALPDEDRAPLMTALTMRADAAAEGIAAEAEAALDAAPESVDGLLAIVELRQHLADLQGEPAVARADEDAARRFAAMRIELAGAAPESWRPPDCDGLYGWSGAEGATERVTLGGRPLVRAFLDEAVVPVFGQPVALWSDADLAAFGRLRAACEAHWQTLAGTHYPIDRLPEDAPPLLQLAALGRWIDKADNATTDARAALAAYARATAAVEAALTE